MKEFAITVLLVAVAGCAAPFHVEHEQLSNHQYPARAKDASVEVIYGTTSRSHVEIAVIEAEPGNLLREQSRAAAIECMKQRARELGATAIKNVEMIKTERVHPGFDGNPVVTGTRRAQCVAIRWADGSWQG